MDPVRTEAASNTDSGLAPDTVTDPTMNYVPLKSIQPYRTQDEFLVAMREDLAEWFNALYGLQMDEGSLFANLSTGVLLCRHANAFNEVLNSSSSASDVIPGSGSAPGHVIQCNRGAQAGTFHSRVNISNFLSWCRSALGLRDTLLFESEDLVQGRNERNVVLCLLEVARRGARIGMLAPSLVQLEAEIDEEIRRDADGVKGDVTGSGHHGNTDDLHGDEGPTKDVAVQTGDDVEGTTGGGGMVQAFLRYSSESICSSESSIRLPHAPVKAAAPARVPISHHLQSAGAATPSRRSRPVIEVDMMSLDEMVRKILNSCTCEFRYPMIRVSEGKYRIGESLTFIFVRILRNHVMVRIGGGWDTLENYLDRHDPCRMESKAPKAGAHSSRVCTHTSNTLSTSSLVSQSTTSSNQSEGHSRQPGDDSEDGSVCSGTFQQDGVPGGGRDSGSQQHRRLDGKTSEHRTSVDSSNDKATRPVSTSDESDDISGTCTRVTPSGKIVVDVACQTDDHELSRRYSSSSGASSLEPTNERLEVPSCKTQEHNHGTLSCDNTVKRVFDDKDLLPSSTEEKRNRKNMVLTNQSSSAAATEYGSHPQKKSSREAHTSAKSSRVLPSMGLCQRCGQTIPVSAKRTNGLCTTCSKQSSESDKKPRTVERPGSAQDKRLRPDRAGSALDRRHHIERPGSAQEKRTLTERPKSAQASMNRPLTVSSKQDTSRVVAHENQKELSGASDQLKRLSKTRPVSAQEKRDSNPRSLPSTRQPLITNRVSAVNPSMRPLSASQQRPASARERRRRTLPQNVVASQDCLEIERDSHSNFALKTTKSEEDLVGEGQSDSNKGKRLATVLRRRSFNNTRTTKLPLVRELQDGINSIAVQNLYIPESTKVQGTVPATLEGIGLAVKPRLRADVQRRGSLTKIPKPAGMP